MVLSTVFVIDTELANGIASAKYFWFYPSMIGVGCCAGLSFVLNPKPVYLNKTDLFVFLFGTVGLLSSYVQHSAINTRFILFLLCFVLYFYFRVILSQNKYNRYILILFVLLTGLAEAVWGIGQLHGYIPSYHGLYKLTGSLFNPGPYGGYLAVISPISCYFLLRDYAIFKHRFAKRFILFYLRYGIAALTFFSTVIILPATMGRASWLATVGGCLFVAIMWIMRSRRLVQLFKMNKRSLAAFVVVVGIFAVIGSVGMYHLKKDSADGRVLMWKVSLLTAVEHPAGVGLGNFAGSYGAQQATYFASGQASEQEEYVAGAPEYAFNEYLQIAVELGVVPLIFYLVSIIAAICTGIRKKRIAEAGALFSLSVFAFMSYPYSVLPFVILLTFLLASASFEAFSKRIKAGKRFTYIGIAVLSLIVIACIVNRIPTYKAYRAWRGVKMLYNIKEYEKVVADYEKWASQLNDQATYLFEYSQCLSMTEAYEKSNAVINSAVKISSDPMFYNIMGKNYQALQKYDSAEICFGKAANIIPNRIYPYYLLTKMYLEAGDTIKAQSMAQIVLTKVPKTESTAVNKMRLEMERIKTGNDSVQK
jgi:tetratricopeptide (TPR) repeat protein